jgi:hypothetical protein
MRSKTVTLAAVGSLSLGAVIGVGALANAQATTPTPAATGSVCDQPLPTGSEPYPIDSANFVASIDNPYWKMRPGAVWVYRETNAAGERSRVRVEVLSRTKSILGIDATVVHDTVSSGGELVENTFDWYGQDVCDNIWYLGENTREYENGHVVSREGSWQAGVDGALAGVAVPGDPQPGLNYRQEYYQGQAEDAGRVLSIDEQVKVETGHYTNVLMTRDTTPLEPRVQEYKFYAPGVGPVLALTVSGGSDREELIAKHH